jgi:hypothetical protein
VLSGIAARQSIEVRYPLKKQKPDFLEQENHSELFDWRPDASDDWEMSFYQSLTGVDGVLLLGGGQSTLIAGLVAIGHGKALLPIATYDGAARKVWQALLPGRDLPTPDDMSVMAKPGWATGQAAECVQSLQTQLARKNEIRKQRRLEERRSEISVTWRAIIAALLFILSVACIFPGWVKTQPDLPTALLLLFAGPLLAGASGATVRLIFDMRQGALPLTKESAITTGALGLVAGGAAGLLFIIAQVTTLQSPDPAHGGIISAAQASKLVAFGVVIGFTAGMTTDAVFRKLIAQDVVSTEAFDVKKRI